MLGSSPRSDIPVVSIITRRTWWWVQSGCLDQMRAALAEAMAVAWLVPPGSPGASCTASPGRVYDGYSRSSTPIRVAPRVEKE